MYVCSGIKEEIEKPWVKRQVDWHLSDIKKWVGYGYKFDEEQIEQIRKILAIIGDVGDV